MTTYNAPSQKMTTYLMDAVGRAIALCDAQKIPYGNITDFSVNRRATSRWGCCKTTYNRLTGVYTHKIEVSINLMSGETDRGLMETLLHEICHAAAPRDHHRGMWLVYARRLNKAYGYNIERTADAEKLGVTESVTVVSREQSIKYVIECGGCGQKICRQKMSATIQHPERYKCGICGGKFARVQ